MISYRIEGNYPIHYSTVTLGFSNEKPIVKVSAIVANLGYGYNGKLIYPIQSGEELIWVCERDAKDSSRVTVALSAPYQAKYQKIAIDMPRGMEDNFVWKIPDEDPTISRSYVGDANFKIQFSQLVEAHEIIDWVKIAGRDCILSPSGSQFIWRDTDPEHDTPLDDITAGYVPECDELTIFVPADSQVDTVQWIAAEPIPIEQMYHKKEHRPFFPKTAFGGVFDHNGNSLSRVMADMTDRMQDAEKDIDNLEMAIGGKVDFDDFVKRTHVNALPTSLESEDDAKCIYHWVDLGGKDHGYFIFAGNDEYSKPIFVRLDNTLEDMDPTAATPNKYYARKLNSATGLMEWKPVIGGGGASGVQDVLVDGESVLDEDGVAEIDTSEFGKVQDVTVDGVSIVDTDGIATINTDDFGKVKDVLVDGTSIVDADGNANIDLTNAIDEKIQELEVDEIGEVGKYIQTIKEEAGKITAVAGTFDTTIDATATDDSAPTSKAVVTVTGLVANITEDAAKSDGTATGTAPANLAEAINNVAKNAGAIKKITDEDGNEFEPDADKVVEIPTATKDDLGLIKTDDVKITTTSTAKTDDAIAMTGKAIEDSLAWKLVADKTGAMQGPDATASNVYAIAAGNGATASGEEAIALGNMAAASGKYAVALAGSATAYQTLAIGPLSSADGDNASAIGPLSYASGKNGVAIGSGSIAMGDNNIVIGFNASSMDDGGIAIGKESMAGENGIAIGMGASASDGAVAIGDSSEANGDGSVALIGGTANGTNSVAIGSTIVTNADNESAIGVYNASHVNTTNPALQTLHAIGAGTAAERKNAVEVTANGDVYVTGVGNYDGKTLPSSTNNVKSLAQVLLNMASLQVLTQTEYDAIPAADIEEKTIYFIKTTDSAGNEFINTFYVGAIPFGSSTGFELNTNKLNDYKL